MIIQPISTQYKTYTPKISSQNKTYSYKSIDNNTNQKYLLGYNATFNNINFGKRLNYNDFLISLHKAYKNKSLKNVILSTISNPKNFIGRGFNADVYEIPMVEDYLIRIERKHFTPRDFIRTPIISEPQNELAPNFGQYVATNNKGFYITKKNLGKSHSLPDWAEKIKGIEQGTDSLTYNNAKLIARKINELSEFPQNSFDILAENIHKLNKYTDCEIDIMNPNNLIVDNDKKNISIIDLWYHHSDNGSIEPFNGTDSMINLMLDPLTHKLVYDKLNIKEKETLLTSSQKIIQKVFTASEKHDLQRTNGNAAIIYKDFDRHSNLEFAQPAYQEFINLYPELL